LVHLISSRIHNAPHNDEKIIYIHGDGGNGKSLLLRFLKTICAKRLQPTGWEYAQTLEGDAFAENLRRAEGAEPVPTLDHDFAFAGMQVSEGALYDMRRKLSGRGLRFPLFDYGAAMYLHKLKRPVRDTFRLPTEEMDLVTALLESFSENTKAAIAQSVLQYLGKFHKDSISLWLKRRYLDDDAIQRISTLDPERELLLELPGYLARDLNTSLEINNAPPAILLLFDTHEAFFGSGQRSPHLVYDDERWFRVFLRHLDLKRIITVVSGRDHPEHWEKLPGQQHGIPAHRLDSHHLGHFSETDAHSYLRLAGVARHLRPAVVRCCTVNPGEVHPFHLGLAANLAEEAEIRSQPLTPEDFTISETGVTQKLLDRLLRYAGDETRRAVEALSACRSFDRDLYRELAPRTWTFPRRQPLTA
jgi:hypothetical protein